MSKQSGATVIEVIIMFALLAIGASIVFLFFGGRADWQKAEKAARAYADQAGIQTTAVQCMHKDSDGDGYCRCTLFAKDTSRVLVDCGCERYCLECAEGCAEVSILKGVEAKGPSRSVRSVEK